MHVCTQVCICEIIGREGEGLISKMGQNKPSEAKNMNGNLVWRKSWQKKVADTDLRKPVLISKLCKGDSAKTMAGSMNQTSTGQNEPKFSREISFSFKKWNSFCVIIPQRHLVQELH